MMIRNTLCRGAASAGLDSRIPLRVVNQYFIRVVVLFAGSSLRTSAVLRDSAVRMAKKHVNRRDAKDRRGSQRRIRHHLMCPQFREDA